MVIQEIDRDEVIRLASSTLALPVSEQPEIDPVFMSSSIRRLAGFLCPCNASRLRDAFIDAIAGLTNINEEFEEVIDDIIEKLIIGGDLLEMNDRTPGLEESVGTLYPAPLSFSIRPNGDALVMGIASDEPNPLGSFSERLEYVGFKRVIRSQSGEDLSSKLVGLGMLQLTEKIWLKFPEAQTAVSLLSDLNIKLREANHSGSIPGLKILDRNRNVMYYKGRWRLPENSTGRFIARRPQVYGNPLWCYAEIANGEVLRFVDIASHAYGILQRPRDVAWWTQMAIDATNENPQRFSIQSDGQLRIISFYSPLPLWAERRLIAIGSWTPAQNCLFSYQIPESELAGTIQFLENYLWLKAN